jgi:hypothetical protein
MNNMELSHLDNMRSTYCTSGIIPNFSSSPNPIPWLFFDCNDHVERLWCRKSILASIQKYINVFENIEPI